MDKTFEFYLKTKDNRYYTINDGVVSIVSIPIFSNPIPLGDIVASWRDVEVVIERALDNWGALIKYSVDAVTFIGKGADILKFIAFNNEMIADVIFKVKKLNTFTQMYEDWTECEIEMTSFDYDLTSVNLTLFEGGLVGLLKNRDNIEYSVTIDNTGIKTKIDGAYVRSSSFWAVGNSNRNIELVSNIQMQSFTDGIWSGVNFTFPNTFGSASVIQGQFVIPDSQDRVQRLGGESIPFMPTLYRLMPMATTTNVWRRLRVKGVFNFTYNCSDTIFSGTEVSIWIIGVHKTIRTAQVAFKVGTINAVANGTWNTYTMSFDTVIPIISQDYLLFQCIKAESMTNSPSTLHTFQIWNDQSRIDFDFESKVAPTDAIGYRYIDFIRKFVNILTDNKYTVQSDFLSNVLTSQQRIDNYGCMPKNIFITSGIGLRRLPNPKITTTWQAILQDLFSQFNIIPSYSNGVVSLEPMKTTLSNQVVFNARNVNNLNISFLKEKVFNSVKVGQVISDNNNIVGLNEFNTTVNFLVQENINTKGELDLVSSFRRDVYGIESARAESIDSDKIDTKFDKDVWLIEVTDSMTDGAYQPYRVNQTFITGVDDPSGIYNTTLSPKRALLRNISYIKSFYNDGQLSFVSSDKNPSLRSNTRVPYSAVANIPETSSERLTNNSFYGITQLRMFTPFVLEFDCSSDYNLVELTSNNLNGLIEFSYNDIPLKGWILSVGCKPSTRDAYRFKLLNHVDNNLSLLR